MRSRNRLLLLTLISILMIANAGASPLLNASESCGEDGCPIPTLNEDNQPVYAIVSPVGYHAVKLIEQSERLDTLADKKIALVGGNFMASVTHDELRKCILEHYPTAVVYMFEQVGSGGP